LAKKVSESQLVVKDNDLIQASFNLSARAYTLLCWLASKIQPNDEDFKKYTIDTKEFMVAIGSTNQRLYTDLIFAIEELFEPKLRLKCKTKKDTVIQIAWLCLVEHRSGGEKGFQFVPELKPYLLQLKEQFTQYELEFFLKLDTFYVKRFYELLKMEEYKGELTVTLENFRDRFRFEKDEYKSYGNFKSRIISPSIKKINEKTDLFVTYKEKKIGRKVDSLEFNIKNKNTTNLSSKINQEILNNHLFEKVVAIGFPKKQTSIIFKDYGDVIVKAAIEVIEEKKDTIDSPKAYFKTVLDNLKRQSEVDNTAVKAPSPQELNLTFEGEFSNCLKTLADSIMHSSYKSWFSDVTFELIGDVLYATCPSHFKVEKVLPYEGNIKKAWNSSGYNVDTVKILSSK
jgi:plasmid replication initiation protein